MDDRNEGRPDREPVEGEADPSQPMWLWVAQPGPDFPPDRLEAFACQPCGGVLVPALYRRRHREFHRGGRRRA